MTFAEWVHESIQRYRTQPMATATHRSAYAFRMGMQRRFGRVIGRTIWSRDWDVLVVLDACRRDLWNEVAPTYGLDESHGVISNASCSIDWIERNFVAYPERAARAGYVTGNPFAAHDAPEARSAGLTDGDLAYFAPLYRTEWGPVDGTEDAVETIPPEPLTDHAIAAWRDRERLGIDRLVVHYMQPHQPYRSKPEWEQIGKNLKNLVDDRDMAGACAWQRCRQGLISEADLWAAYRDNLEWVLDDVTERLLANLDADRVAITADHGNAMGEWGEWGHPPGAISPAVRRVPWVTVAASDHQTVDSAAGFDIEDDQTRNTSEQLEALGYK